MELINIKYNRRMYIVLSIFIILYVYTFIHESGHALIGIISGGRIDEFVVGFNAHVRIIGAHYNNITLPLEQAFGVLLPIILALFLALAYNEKIKSEFYHLLNFLFYTGTMATLTAWIIIPILYFYGTAPVNDDVTKFIRYSNLDFWWVSLFAIMLIITLGYIGFKVKKIHRRFFLFKKRLNMGNSYFVSETTNG